MSMILEVAILDVRPGRAEDFVAAFADAQTIIASMPGYICHQLRRGMERPDRFILLVTWETLEAHTVGFRGSPQYQEWRAKLHPFYDPFPVVEHYQPVPELES
jgi:heme-degrading monooxygenase HmoA